MHAAAAPVAPLLGERALHLRPRSRDDQRIWQIGGDAGQRAGLQLAVRPDEHATFASLDAILAQLAPFTEPAEEAALARVAGYLAEVRPDASGDGWGRLLRDSVTFAVMRRVSRESYYTARIIDASARTINAVLARMPYARVHVAHADRLDRPTLKVLARAMLLLEPEHPFAWVWHLDSDPTRVDGGQAGLFAASRTALLQQLLGMLAPTIVRGGAAAPHPAARDRSAGGGLEAMASELVMQNYDRCFLLGPALLRGADDATASEVRRLTGLAAVNVGRIDDALAALRAAEAGSDAARRAHLAYLQGLIESKRRYDLAGSSAEYQRGLRLLEHGTDGDLALERGWLLNGLGLNEAILWRRDPDGERDRHAKAFALEQEAFALVRDGSSPSRMYLRFNLLANSALLMEMAGRHDVAIDIFQRTFDFDVDRSAANQSRWESTMGYRIGVLHQRAGRIDAAEAMLRHASEQDDVAESWPVRERILRALATVALARGETDAAAAIFRSGLDICIAARGAEGAREHALGLSAALLAAGRPERARELVEELQQRERLDLADARPRPPSPKLPAYFPEIDLEGIPAIDLNRFLGTQPGRGERTPWRD